MRGGLEAEPALNLGHRCRLPAAKCSGVDLRPAMSLAFTFTASTSFFTRETSPFRQASNSSRKAPPPPPLLPWFPAPDSGVETELVPLPSVGVGELPLLPGPLLPLLLLAVRAGPGEEAAEAAAVVGESGASSPSAASSIAPLGGSGASSAGAGGEPGGPPRREEPRGGEGWRLDGGGGCCRAARRDVAIFTAQQPPTSNKTPLTTSGTESPTSGDGSSNWEFSKNLPE